MNATSIAALLLPSLIRFVAALIRAKERNSDGGRRITRAEWDDLLDVFTNEVLHRTRIEVVG